MSDIKYQISSIKYQVSVVKSQLSSIKLQVSHCKYQDARGIKREQVIAILKLFCYLLTHLPPLRVLEDLSLLKRGKISPELAKPSCNCWYVKDYLNVHNVRSQIKSSRLKS